MDKKTAAEVLGVSEKTISRYVASGRLTARYIRGKTGQQLDFDSADVQSLKAELAAPVEVAPAVPSEAAGKPSQAKTGRDNALSRLVPAGDETGNGAAIVAAIVAQTVKEIEAQRTSSTADLAAKLFLTVTEAASYAGVGRSAIEAAIKTGQIEAHAGLGRGRRIKRAAVEAWAKKI